MTTAQQIKRDYAHSLEQMFSEAVIWSRNHAKAVKGLKEWFFYTFADGSTIEFEVYYDNILKAS